MARYGRKRLSAEDRILWNRVARTARPLAGKAPEPEPASLRDAPSFEDIEKKASSAPRAGVEADAVSAAPARKGRPLSHLDRPTRNRLARERLPIEARVDLHGLTQAEAHGLLLSFLERARQAGLRHVLVITGKGASGGSDGALRRAVPGWLATAPFRPLVSAHDQASRRHGGAGALYVRLRRLHGARS